MAVPLRRASNLAMALDTPRGRGIVACAAIEKDEIIDTAPVIVLSATEFEARIKDTSLLHYSYNWPVRRDDGKTEVRQAIVLGLGSMFNHSAVSQNVGWRRDVERQVVVYTALRRIEEGEELLISYGACLTFEDVEKGLLREVEGEVEDPLAMVEL